MSYKNESALLWKSQQLSIPTEWFDTKTEKVCYWSLPVREMLSDTGVGQHRWFSFFQIKFNKVGLGEVSLGWVKLG